METTPGWVRDQVVALSALLMSSAKLPAEPGCSTCVIFPFESMMYAVGVAATRQPCWATVLGTRIVGTRNRKVLTASAGDSKPFGPRSPALIAAVTIGAPPIRDRNRLTCGNSFRQWGQVFS